MVLYHAWTRKPPKPTALPSINHKVDFFLILQGIPVSINLKIEILLYNRYMHSHIKDKFTRHLSLEKCFAERTVETYLEGINYLYSEHGGEILGLKEYREVADLICSLRDNRKWSDRTTYKLACEVTVFYNWAFREGIIEESPLRLGHQFKKTEKKAIDFFDWDDEKFKLLVYNPLNSTRDNAILHTLRSAGLRASELCKLKVADVDLKERWIHVRQGKGSQDRFVPFDDETRVWLSLYIEALKRHNKSGCLFMKDDYSKCMTASMLYKMIRRKGEKIGIRSYPHKFRKSLGGALIAKGADITVAQQILGHKNCSTTAKYYVGFKKEKLRDMYDQHTA